jgi:hypothetical protein
MLQFLAENSLVDEVRIRDLFEFTLRNYLPDDDGATIFGGSG